MSVKPSLYLIGSGGHAKSILASLSFNLFSSVTSITWGEVEFPSKLGVPHKHVSDFTDLEITTDNLYFIAIGDRALRKYIYDQLVEIYPDIQFANVIASSSVVASDTAIGTGVFIGANSYIGPGCQVENQALINTGCVVEHDARISEFAILSPGVVLGGNVSVGRLAFVGIGSNVRDNIRLGDSSVVGAGSLVLKDTVAGKLYYGTPAKVID